MPQLQAGWRIPRQVPSTGSNLKQLVKKITGWHLSTALLFIASGTFAITEPRFAELGITLVIGWLLIFGGLSHLIGAFKRSRAKPIIFQVLVGIAYLMAGFYCLRHPLLPIGPAMFPFRKFVTWSQQ